MNTLSGKAALVTGAASGIGQGIALGFLRAGAHVMVADINEASETQELATAEGFGDRIRYIRTDVTEDKDVSAAVQATQAAFGHINVLVNNAGGPGAMEPLLDMDAGGFDRTFGLLARSVFLGIQHVGRAFRAQGGGGVILSTGSIAARFGGCSPTLYAAAKAAVVQLTAMAAVELAPWRIRVNSVSPGAIMIPGFTNSGITPERLAQMQPWPEAGRPEDVAAVMVFLASDQCRFATGSDFVIDGGLGAQGPMLLQRLYGEVK